MNIPFFQPCYGKDDLARLEEALLTGRDFRGEVKEKLQAIYGQNLFLTSSATAAFELLFSALQFERGDEIIMPSFTFPSCASAAVRAGLRPVFAEIDRRVPVLDQEAVMRAITARTRAVIPMHYGGASVDLHALKRAIGEDILLIEDAALSFGARYKGIPLGAAGDFGVLSFQRTKNVSADEGGMLIVNEKHERLNQRIRMLMDNGTDKEAHLLGKVDAYTWQMAGLNACMSFQGAALLSSQLDKAPLILERHKTVWQRYCAAFVGLAQDNAFAVPYLPEYSQDNHEVFYLLFDDADKRKNVQEHLKEQGIGAYFHYMPLHSSAMGKRINPDAALPVTQSVSERLLRLPVYAGMTNEQCDAVIGHVKEALKPR